jgi:hypothetical protein
MSKPSAFVLLLVLIGTFVFLFNYNFTDAYIDSPDHLAVELRSPLDSAYTWKISNDVPFKYRLLFPKVVQTTWAAVRSSPNDNETFVAIYRSWCYLLFITSILTFSWLLRVVGFSPKQVFAGSLVFTLLPAMSFAFSVPVHTREDLLCYTILHLGLIALLKEKKLIFLLLAIVGVFCRETLLLLPFVYFFYSKETIFTRFVISGIPGVMWIMMRWLAGNEKYNALGDGLGDNLENIFITCAFLFMSFNVFWLPFFAMLATNKKTLSKELKVIFRSAWPAFILVFATTFFLGRVMEIRLLYLLAPWIIPVVLYGVAQHREEIIKYFRSARFIVLALGSLVFISIIYGAVWRYRPELYSMMKGYWWTVLFLSTQLCIISLPLLGPMARPFPSGNLRM